MSRLSSHFAVKDPRLGSLSFPLLTATSVVTAGNATYTTAQLLSGLILRDPAGNARTDTLPTAADLVEAIQGAMVGTSFQVHIRNCADASEVLTIAAGTGGTVSGTATIAQNYAKDFLFVLTNVTIGSEAYSVYSKGTAAY